MNMDVVYKNLLDAFPGNVYWVDTDGVILGCNDQQAESLGFSSTKDIVGKNIAELLPKKEVGRLLSLQDEVIDTGETITIEEELTFKGEPLYFLSQKSPLKSLDGEAVGLMGFSIDITQHKIMSNCELEDSREELAMVKGIQSVLFESLSHDLRTPIHCMRMLIDVMLGETNNPTHSKYLKDMNTSIDWLLEHCSSLYENCRSRKIRKSVLVNEPLDLQSLCDDIISFHGVAATAKKIDIIGEYDADIPLLLGDNQRIKQILLHLLSNAIKFTTKGGVSLQVEIFPQSNNGVIPQKVFAKISVRDTGKGISEHLKPVIFEEFAMEPPAYLTQYQGLGLGLSMVKKLVVEMKGELKVDSEQGKGSTFIVYLPLTVSYENSC